MPAGSRSSRPASSCAWRARIPATSASAPPSPRSRPPRPPARSRRSSTSRAPRRSAPTSARSQVLHAAGLRSLGPVWSRPNAFGVGIPFRFPGDPDEGPGLTPAGKDLVRACNRLGILFDLSHLNAAGFRDVAALSTAPLVATHSNAHAVSPASRNLTDAQLDAIAESGGVVGLNYAVGFLRDDGRRVSDTRADGDDPPPRPPARPARRGRRRPRLRLRRRADPARDRRRRRPPRPRRRHAPGRLRRRR